MKEDYFNDLSMIKSKEDFIEFVQFLRNDLLSNKQRWENVTLEDYLDGIENWVESMEEYYEHMKVEIPKDINWRVFADILMAASIYE